MKVDKFVTFPKVITTGPLSTCLPVEESKTVGKGLQPRVDNAGGDSGDKHLVLSRGLGPQL